MKYASTLAIVLALSVACGTKTAETEAVAPEPAAAPAPPPPPEPTAEEKKKAEDAKKLEEDRAKLKADNEAEAARWTPELHAEAKAVAEKTYPTGKAAIKAALAAKYREPGNAERDAFRHPLETLEFLGFKPTLSVLEYGPGEGWYTEILAPALAKKGKLYATSADPNGAPDQRSTLNGERFKSFLERAPELYGKVEPVYVDPKAPDLKQEGTLDMVLVFRGLHGMQNNGQIDAWLKEIHDALKPKGVLGIEQHRAKADAKAEDSSKSGYLPEAWVVEKIEAAGFKLAGKSEINANPKDTTDHPKGVWTLPPSYALGETDHDKYAAIGESDRMTLKFTKK